MFGLTFIWMCRLSYNTYRRGLFRLSDEDYRWQVLRSTVSPLLFQFTNFVFISGIQNVLLLLLGLPAKTAALQADTSLSASDYALAALALTLLLVEFTADNQQYAYHAYKHSYLARQKDDKTAPYYNQLEHWVGSRLSWSLNDAKRGFVTRGLWAYSRHPNFFCEQAFWLVITLLPLLAPSAPNLAHAPLSVIIASLSDSEQREALCAALYPTAVHLLPALSLSALFFSSTLFTESISKKKYPQAISSSDPLAEVPDFGRYQLLRTLSAEEFPLDDPDRRVIMVGDIHGMYRPLTRLLTKLDYDPNSDVLVHTGDFLVKGLHHHSIATLDFMALHNITGVRGNHDQEVIEWKGWIDWIRSTKEGSEWLQRMEQNWKHIHNGKKPFNLDHFLDYQRHSASGRDKRWWKLIPAGWKFLSDPYRIARDMSKEQYEYLLSLPLALYIPSAHTFVVHAGILPSDPRYPYYDRKRQPLARIPGLSRSDSPDSVCSGSKDRLSCMSRVREAQELAILSQIPQNKHPWVLMNMRGIKKGKVFRSVSYRYLVYGRKLSAVVLGGDIGLIDEDADDWTIEDSDGDEVDDESDDEDDESDENEDDQGYDDEDDEVDSNKRRRKKKHHDGDTIRFGVNRKAKLATVKCP
ncbi:hypothetical protein EST38_g4131 [Candolleomyces aberdarensis]|uniref:Calcineurin-like phosphoesterase domain-containing protein n=1 Tax=Candolleomyces aberdarensis TaxID=2316362 RepID=A0A4Q2DQH2_9AGAR|nr:hypothetical protein EST38_g4131 [Candolleomyces aberdarensis]